MSRRAYLYFILTFVLGVVVGCAATIYFGWYSGRWHHHFSEKHVVHYLQRELNLSAAQTEQVKGILDQTNAKYKTLQEKVNPEFEAIRNESRSEIRKVLNPQQQTKFDEMVRRFEARHKQHRRP